MGFGERLRQLREEQGWDRYELARRLTSSYSAVAKWETGARAPDHNTLIEIADLFDVSVDYLLGRTRVRRLPEDRIPTYDELTPERIDQLSGEFLDRVFDAYAGDVLAASYSDPRYISTELTDDEKRQLLKIFVKYDKKMAREKAEKEKENK